MHYRITLLLVVLLLVPSGDLGAQSVFATSYPLTYNNSIWVRGSTDAFGGFVVSLRSTDTYPASFASSLLFTDDEGEVVSLTRYEHGASDLISGVVRSSDGSIYTSGLIREQLGQFEAAYLRHHAPNGALDWARAYGIVDADEAQAYHLARATNGDLYCAGSVSFGAGAFPMIFKTDANGSVLWARQLSADSVAWQFLNILSVSDGGVLLTGRMSTIGSTGPRMALVRMDQDGDLVWARWFDAGLHSELNSALEAPSGGFIAFGRVVHADSWNGVVVNVDEEGTVTSNLTWGINIKQGVVLLDGSLMLTGAHEDKTVCARLVGGEVAWSTMLNSISEGVLVPFDEGTRFAYLSSELLGDVTIHTLTDECEACDSVPVPWEDVGELEITSGSFLPPITAVELVSAVVPITEVPMALVTQRICDLNADMIAESPMSAVRCFPAAGGTELRVEAPEPFEYAVVVDATGRLLPTGLVTTRTNDGTWTGVIPFTASSGVYVVQLLGPGGSAACRFVPIP